MFRRSFSSIVLGCTGVSADLAAVMVPAPAIAQSTTTLKLRRLGDRVDLVVSGLETTSIDQSTPRHRWLGRLRSASSELTAPSSCHAVSLEVCSTLAATHSGFELSVQAMQGMALPEPVISTDGSSLIVSFRRLPIRTTAAQSGRLDLTRPGRVQQPVVVPPMRACVSSAVG